MIEELHCLNCERDFTGTPATMVFQFTHHDCFQQIMEQKEAAMCNHPSNRDKDNNQ
jgi:hypothetical protein